MLDIDGISPLFWREEIVAQAVGTFGMFLGSIKLANDGILSRWTVIAATVDLRKVPRKINFVAAGLKTSAFVRVRRWVHMPLYDSLNLPPFPPSIVRPCDRVKAQTITQQDRTISGPRWLLDNDHVVMSLKAMRDILKDIDPSTLPDDIRLVLQGDKTVIHNSHIRAQEEATAVLPGNS